MLKEKNWLEGKVTGIAKHNFIVQINKKEHLISEYTSKEYPLTKILKENQKVLCQIKDEHELYIEKIKTTKLPKGEIIYELKR